VLVIALLLQAAAPETSLVCGPAVPDQSLGAAYRYVAGAAIVDERGQRKAFERLSPDRCKTDTDKTPPKRVGIPKVVGAYIS
jgi:hypothetical protein